MPSLKGLAMGLGAVIVVGYLALRTGAARGIRELATGVTEAVASPFAGLGTGLTTLAAGVSDIFSPTIAPTIAPKFDWSKWLPFGPGNGNGNGIPTNGGGARTEDRKNGNGIVTVHGPDPTYVFKPTPPTPTLPGYTPRPEDRAPPPHPGIAAL